MAKIDRLQIPDVMQADVLELYQFAVTAHEYIYSCVTSLRKRSENMTPEQLADVAYVLRETEKYLKDCEKETKYALEQAQRLACLKWLVNNTCGGEPIRTQYCTAVPKMKTTANVPTIKNNPVAYHKLMDYLGIDVQLRDRGKEIVDGVENSTEVVSVHWPGLQYLIERLTAAGYSLPDGLDLEQTYTTYSLVIQSRRKLERGKPQEQTIENTAESQKPNAEDCPF